MERDTTTEDTQMTAATFQTELDLTATKTVRVTVKTVRDAMTASLDNSNIENYIDNLYGCNSIDELLETLTIATAQTDLVAGEAADTIEVDIASDSKGRQFIKVTGLDDFVAELNQLTQEIVEMYCEDNEIPTPTVPTWELEERDVKMALILR
jgi:hypothetical protein